MSFSSSIEIKIITTPSSGTQYNPMGDPVEDNIEIDSTGGGREITAATTPGTELQVSKWLSTIKSFLVKNKDDTNFVTLSWTDNDANANDQKIPAGRSMLIPDINPASTLKIVADTAACVCKMNIDGDA